jgi:hypothetical protein
MVAVHNDYRQGGELKTFWLMTHPSGRYVQAEGLVVVEDKVLEELREKAKLAIEEFTASADSEPVKLLPPPAPAPKAEPKLDRQLMAACAERVVRRGRPVAPERWDAKEMCQYLGCLLESSRDAHAPPKFFDMKERRGMSRLIAWLKPKGAKRLLEYVVSNWQELADHFGIKASIPTVPIIYGFRQSLVDAMENGLRSLPAVESRTHRDDFEGDTTPRQQRAFG